jgi:HEAT repeat protein
MAGKAGDDTMGLLDKMFGGGTGVELQLDATQVPVGGMLSGRVIVRGGKKDLSITDLRVRLLYVCVTARDDSPIPNIDTRILVDHAITANQPLPSAAEQSYTFQLQIPGGTNPTAHNTSYKVTAVADIPGVKDPSSTVDLKVMDSVGTASFDEIYARWPALRGSAERPLIDALWDFNNAIWNEREALVTAEPLLAGIIRSNGGEARKAAINAWANLLDGHVRKEHLRLLGELTSMDLDIETTKQVVEAAAKFADEGALGYVQGFVRHPDPEIRRALGQALRFGAADSFPGKRDLVLALAVDQDAEVREAAFGALSDFRNDVQVMQMCAAQIDRDPSPDVQAACIGALCFGHHHGMGELTLHVYERHLANPHERVRKAIAEEVHWLPDTARQHVASLVHRLLQDPSDEVRRAMAWQFRNLSEMAELAPMLRYVIDNDASSEVRKDALGALTAVVPIPEAVAFYRQRLQQIPSEDTAWGVLDGVRFKDDPAAKALLAELANSPFASVARAARDAMS